ncbi:nucleotidyltransferase domain-containing protein [Candidatus Woesearchaeota archaeon]|jgi:predicted nucleotidyltransferase|nr:nucleotidyltransferase domain-containing protein [Candidatus Woesearchaeota archaeon]MBT3438600.1 nucleotidyltransferase domain-containing protein [Candidatus Woesearchaeota archaeon]MBT4058502.1 nucleotidyltransferase domain-containing protein [Candidatus Woesearchaeota archaeon]MBT4207285.1 nucleotidyltransferase domain-containing protein [Candidatus Woesearchaeota archaeon]MBT4733193.1 nucleotidyltransferase domain-containing protein [Candidatus Woesearchaeota archaeon]
MKIPIKKRENKNLSNFLFEDLKISRKFAKLMYQEFGKFISSMVLFGSATKNIPNPKRDIDILIVLDDTRIQFTQELVQTYRIILEKTIAKVDPRRLHIQTMKLTSFWEYARAGDPVAINILRSGVALIDTNVFDPLQALLEQGRIRPSQEAVWTYYTMAPASLRRSEQHLLTAAVDLYWAAVDAAHAALMHAGQIPPSPDHVAEMLQEKLNAPHQVSRKSLRTMKELYLVFKKIVHRDIKSISGKDYDVYKKKAEDFVDEMKEFLENHPKN